MRVTKPFAAKGARPPSSENELQAAANAETRQLKIRLYTSVVLCVILMAAAMGPMAGLAVPAFLDPRVSPVSAALTQLLLTIPVVALNFKFFRQGTKGLIHGAPNMDTLVAIGAGASLLFGIFALYRMVFALEAGDAAQTMHYAHSLYFDSAAMILTLITVGKYFDAPLSWPSAFRGLRIFKAGRSLWPSGLSKHQITD